MNSKPLKTVAPVSVIIPCYCCDEIIERACLSVTNQSVLPSQIILVDDASQDAGRTAAKIDSLAGEIKEVWGIECTTIFLEENLGPGEARNRGWEAAHHDFIAFLDADDTWHPSKIEIQLSWMKANPLIDLTCHHSVIFDRFDYSQSLDPEFMEIEFSNMLYRNKIQTRTVMFRRVLQNRFLKGQRFSEDYRLWLDVLIDRRRVVLLNIELASSHRPEYSMGGQSSNLWKMEYSEIGIYWDLYCNKKISVYSLMSTSLFSLVKFFIRTLKSGMYSVGIPLHHGQ